MEITNEMLNMNSAAFKSLTPSNQKAIINYIIKKNVNRTLKPFTGPNNANRRSLNERLEATRRAKSNEMRNQNILRKLANNTEAQLLQLTNESIRARRKLQKNYENYAKAKRNINNKRNKAFNRNNVEPGEVVNNTNTQVRDLLAMKMKLEEDEMVINNMNKEVNALVRGRSNRNRAMTLTRNIIEELKMNERELLELKKKTNNQKKRIKNILPQSVMGGLSVSAGKRRRNNNENERMAQTIKAKRRKGGEELFNRLGAGPSNNVGLIPKMLESFTGLFKDKPRNKRIQKPR